MIFGSNTRKHSDMQSRDWGGDDMVTSGTGLKRGHFNTLDPFTMCNYHYVLIAIEVCGLSFCCNKN